MDRLIQARIQELMREGDDFRYDCVTLGDYSVLDKGAPPYCVISPGGMSQPRDRFDGGNKQTWSYEIDIVERYQYGDPSAIVSARQAAIDKLNAKPLLGALAGVISARVTGSADLDYLFPKKGDTPTFSFFRLTLEVTNFSQEAT